MRAAVAVNNFSVDAGANAFVGRTEATRTSPISTMRQAVDGSESIKGTSAFASGELASTVFAPRLATGGTAKVLVAAVAAVVLSADDDEAGAVVVVVAFVVVDVGDDCADELDLLTIANVAAAAVIGAKTSTAR